ncbi:hypothetical protein D0894_12185 [Pseudomonas monteilii]|uniref:Uncharacterized protein n=1 Tax=Pseudomonas monteilii TaxID=76759 RepID=A0A399M6E8_9PSED|nr:hypothetical protein D0894_12185 [Pseudomonas monteilii]
MTATTWPRQSASATARSSVLPRSSWPLVAAYCISRSLNDELQSVPFVLSLVLLFIGQSGFEISVWPNTVGHGGIWHAAAGEPGRHEALRIVPTITMRGAFSLSVLKSTEREIEYGICNS